MIGWMRYVEVKLMLYESALLRAAGDADRPRARDLRELAHQRPDRPGGCRDHYGFACARFANQM
jgi:hypothetical protein